jgi:transcription elongation factor Elf1
MQELISSARNIKSSNITSVKYLSCPNCGRKTVLSEAQSIALPSEFLTHCRGCDHVYSTSVLLLDDKADLLSELDLYAAANLVSEKFESSLHKAPPPSLKIAEKTSSSFFDNLISTQSRSLIKPEQGLGLEKTSRKGRVRLLNTLAKTSKELSMGVVNLISGISLANVILFGPLLLSFTLITFLTFCFPTHITFNLKKYFFTRSDLPLSGLNIVNTTVELKKDPLDNEWYLLKAKIDNQSSQFIKGLEIEFLFYDNLGKFLFSTELPGRKLEKMKMDKLTNTSVSELKKAYDKSKLLELDVGETKSLIIPVVEISDISSKVEHYSTRIISNTY